MRHPIAAVLSSVLLLLVAAPMATAAACPPPAEVAVARTDQQPTGNRVVRSCDVLGAGVVDIDLPEAAAWVLADPAAPRDGWLVAYRDGRVRRVPPMDGGARRKLAPGAPPLAWRADDGSVAIRNAQGDRRGFTDPLHDARVVRGSDERVLLVGPTERYPHGALGDAVEASAIEIAPGTAIGEQSGEPVRVELAADQVIEGLTPILADLDDDGDDEILVTVSDAADGARLRAYDLDGEVVAESEPIGQGFRWLHQIGVGVTGPAGETEIIAVRTPHIGGVVEAYRLQDDRLERVAAIPGYSSHKLGSSNLDMALLTDVDADGRLEVVVPTQDMTALAILARTADGFVSLAELPLGGRLASNLAAAVDEDGRLRLAAGIEDGRLRVFG